MSIPSNSPLILPVVICQGGCRQKMRVETTYSTKGIVTRMLAYCDQCKYGRDLSLIYASGLDTKYEAPKEPSVAPSIFTPPPPAPQYTRPTGSVTPQAVGADAEGNPELTKALQDAQESAAGLTGS